MSAPNTNLETQKERHKGPLAGIRLAVIVAAALFAGLVVWLSANGDPAEPAPAAEVSN